jgi:hypothetical protein
VSATRTPPHLYLAYTSSPPAHRTRAPNVTRWPSPGAPYRHFRVRGCDPEQGSMRRASTIKLEGARRVPLQTHVPNVTPKLCCARQNTVARPPMIKRSSSPDGRKRSTPQRGRPMEYLLMRLQQDEELLRRVTEGGVGPKPGPLRAQRQRSPKPRSRRHAPVANALAAWRAYDARRRAQGETPA